MRFTLGFVLFSLCVHYALSHAAMVGPFPARNVVNSSGCANCANGAGVCGEGGQWPADASASDLNSGFTTPLGELKAGSTIEVALQFSASHKGHFYVELCRPTGSKITNECFTHRMERDPTDNRYSPYVSSNPAIAIFQDNSCISNAQQLVKFIVPTTFGDCDHCVMRFHWQTGNSCASHPLQSSSIPAEVAAWRSVDGCGIGTSGQMPACGDDQCPHPRCNFEQFRNCVDVKITGSGGPAPTTPPMPTDAPTVAPTVAPPTESNEPCTPCDDCCYATPPMPTNAPVGNDCCPSDTYAAVAGMKQWCIQNSCSPSTHCQRC